MGTAEAAGAAGFPGDPGSGVLEGGVQLSKGGGLAPSHLCGFIHAAKVTQPRIRRQAPERQPRAIATNDLCCMSQV